MRYCLMIEPQQGLSYADQLALARRAESLGFEAFFRSDHYESFPGDAGRATTDAWAVLAGLARETTTIRLGSLVSPVTFRHAGAFAKVVATVQAMSGGRMEVGVGAGWHEQEHRRHGVPFPEISERADMLEETLTIMRGLWQELDGWSFDGAHWSVADALFRPRPDPVPPLIVGGTGTPRSYRLAARWADEFNLTSTEPGKVAATFTKIDEACRAIGRDPSTLRRSAMVGVLVGRDAGEVSRRTADLMAGFGATGPADAWFAEHEPRWIFGTPAEARARADEFAAAGVGRIMLQDYIPLDLDHLDVMAEALFV